MGTNDVPKFGGGLYWGEDSDDAREFHGGWDTRDRKKEETFAEILKVLKENEWLGENLKNLEIPELVKRATPLLKRTRLFNLIEFGRATHAEMEALLSAARRGISIKDCTLYTTTFPCHDCARHIVASGIRKVVYIEPYAKSLASQFHLDSFLVDQNIETSGFVSCHSFVGIAPRVYMELFPMLQRKDKEGRVKLWNREIAIPRMHSSPLAYMDNEAKEAKTLSEKMNEAGFKPI
ncbi:deaminase [Candidatus Nitrospira allomarina]|uniref:deaminase n=1 Tax=Candidatus Nitrospira allomarina TaxID=3020900 RepID=UPI0035E3EC43